MAQRMRARGALGRDLCPEHAGHLGAGDPAGEVDQVRAEVEQRVVGDGVRAPPATAVGDLRDHRHLRPGRRGRAQRRDRGIEPPVEGDERGGVERGQCHGAGPVRRGRLLHQHRQPAGGGAAGVVEVDRGGRGEDEGVDVRTAEQCGGVGEGGQATGEGGEAAAAQRVRFGDGGEDHVAGGGRGGQVADLREPSGPDEPDAHGAGHEATMIVGSGAGAAPVRLPHPTC
jgi:hypothetical protein